MFMILKQSKFKWYLMAKESVNSYAIQILCQMDISNL